MSDGTTSPLLRTRTPGAHARVGFVELFFDLVFVFAVTQLSHALIAHPTPLGVAQTALLLMAVWWAWMYTTWATNWLEVEHRGVRTMLFAVMAAGVVMSSSIPHAFDKAGLVFASAYVLIQLGRTAFLLYAVRGDAVLRSNFQRVLLWFAVSGVFWLLGGVAEGPARLACWAVALGIDYLGPVTMFWAPGLGKSSTHDWTVEGGHMAERCGLFIIIALGESILVTGATFADHDWTPGVISAFASAFLSTVAMWWIYFSANAEAASEAISSSDDPGRVARIAYTYMHIFLVAGIIVTAVGDEWALAHPDGDTDLKTALVLLGGPALFLLGSLLFKLSVFGHVTLSRLAGLAALGLLGIPALSLSPMIVSWLATGVLIVVSAWETLVYQGQQATGHVA
ncbi:MAG: low temperature requirement protein A [Pseudomonadota bacterium]